jgi:OOP family OmpA-OmpF porin
MKELLMLERPHFVGSMARASTVVAMFAAPSSASALEKLPLAPVGTGADTHLYRPPVDSKGFISVNGADVVPHLDFSLGLFLDYGHGLLPTKEGKHGEHGDFLLQHSLQGTFQANVGVANLLVFGVSVPVVLSGHETVEDIGPTGELYTSQGGFAQGLGNLAVHAKVRIIRPLDTPSVGLAAILQGGAGVAGADNLIAENVASSGHSSRSRAEPRRRAGFAWA